MKQPKRGSRERRPQTLDLTATEIVSDPVNPEPVENPPETPAEPDEAAPASAEPSVATSPAAPQPDTAAEEQPRQPDWLNVASTSETAAAPSQNPPRRLNWEN